MRPYTMRMTPPFTMIGSSVAEVEESKHPSYPKGSTIIILAGWVERGVVSPDTMGKDSPGKTLGGVMPAPDLGPLSKSLLLGACGMPGNTAYFGLLEICKPKAGETVVVSGAAGAVGSLVGQIAKIKGCNVVGFAGSDEKCAWLRSIGFDHAFNYKKSDVAESLKTAAPKGVDCYFDNVGGEMSIAVLNAMNTRGRASICGAISHYNEVGGYSKTTDILPLCIFKELMVEGFLVGRRARLGGGHQGHGRLGGRRRHQGEGDDRGGVRQDAAGPHGALHRGEHRQDAGQGLMDILICCMTSYDWD